ncbi:regulator of PEP synthase PpsR (kinase-PPPase family) [Microbacterium sp. BE35]|uniref:pyruvate, water dikinase regulatory protein n=1 Tax=Microbacterium sp. BE35 TaxID=2817773 RepID=UPI002865477E|nr:pyruvate, water dikinase regulatory protein [Microbacterium sp. BE35]MDR7188172.1 regulator of PEP synthase PpsR (kinase-PPPase family) [Microbacterium sp. BE35]
MKPPLIDRGDRPLAYRSAYFVSDSTGITAETLGNALLSNFPGFTFAKHTIPFVDTAEGAAAVVRDIDADAQSGLSPILFTTTKDPAVKRTLGAASATVIDLLSGHLTELEAALETTASEQLGRYHALGDATQYFARMRAVEYAIEHDDGQSSRALDIADVVIIAPSRCGKTPTTMYLALQYGLLVANYPLTDDDFPTDELPSMVASYAGRCFGITTTPLRLSQVRHERRPDSRYASLAQCSLELRRAEDLYRRNRVPFLNSSTKSVEEMSAVILQTLKLRA